MFSKYNNTDSNLLNRRIFFEERLKQVHPHLKVIGEYVKFTGKIEVEDKYGICRCFGSKLLAGTIPCIRTAIDKTSYFINQAKELHGDTYNYSKTKWDTNGLKKVTITCPLHGDFKQSPNHHLRGQGCRKCTLKDAGGWYEKEKNFEKKTTLYVLEFSGNGESFKKFGLAVDLESRIERLEKETKYIYKITVLKTLTNTVKHCYKLEQRFKKRIIRKRLQYIPKIRFGGISECFKQ